MRRLSVCLCILLALSAAAGTGQEAVRVEKREYHGWRDAYHLSNGTVDLVFVPQIGRIMRYGFAGEGSVLWENAALRGKVVPPEADAREWVNYGGDKLWPAPQARWGWPPDPVLDRGAHKVEPLSGGRLRVTGPPSMKSGIRFIREIELAPTGTGVTLHNTMLNSGEQPVEWSVWEVAQVDDPEEAYIPLHKGGRFPEGYSLFQTSPPEPETVSVKDGRVSLRRHRTKGGKLGGDSPEGWTEAGVRGTRFRVSMTPEKGAEYPDEGRFLQLWSNPDPLPYMELEVLSPLRKLTPGERTTFTTRWRLAKAAD